MAHFLQAKYSDIDDYVVLVERARQQLARLGADVLDAYPELRRAADVAQRAVALVRSAVDHLALGERLKRLVAHVRNTALREFTQSVSFLSSLNTFPSFSNKALDGLVWLVPFPPVCVDSAANEPRQLPR